MVRNGPWKEDFTKTWIKYTKSWSKESSLRGLLDINQTRIDTTSAHLEF